MCNNEEYYISFLCTYLHFGVLDVVLVQSLPFEYRACRGRDRMVVGITTTYAISDCHQAGSWKDLWNINNLNRNFQRN
jgi:hypothetical protein